MLAALLLGTTLVGTFFQGDGASFNYTLVLDARGRYRYNFHGSFSNGSTTGNYSIAGSKLRLSPPDSYTDTGKRPPSNFVIVRWQERTYLLTPDDTEEFVTRVRSGWRGKDEWADGPYFRDGAKWGKTAPALTGLPKVPSPWNIKVGKPLQVRVSKIISGYVTSRESLGKRNDPREIIHFRRGFMIDAGDDDGITLGMSLTAPNGARATVLKAQKRSATCVWEPVGPRAWTTQKNGSMIVKDRGPSSRARVGASLKLF